MWEILSKGEGPMAEGEGTLMTRGGCLYNDRNGDPEGPVFNLRMTQSPEESC